MSKPSMMIVLAEDQRQKQFIYRYLTSAGFRRKEMRFHLSPSGRGAAEQWVRENFVVQVRVCRTRQAQTGMIVLLDADTRTVQQRLDALDQSLVETGQRRIESGQDTIARLIPKRNVETWILFLARKGVTAPPIDELTDYKRDKNDREWSELIPGAVDTLHAWTNPSTARPATILDGLRFGLEEIPRAFQPK